MDPYVPPAPGYLPPPAPGQEGARSQNWYIVWLVLSCLTLCGCGILAVIPIGLSIAALVSRDSPGNSARLLNRIAIVCVVLNWIVLLAYLGFMVVSVVIGVLES